MKNDIIFWSGIWNHRFPELVRPIAPYELSHWLRLNNYRSQVIEFVQHMSTDDLIELTELALSKDTFAIAVSTTFWPLDGIYGTTIGVNGVVPSNISEAILKLKEKYPKLEFIAGGHRTSRFNKIFDRVFDTIETDGENQILKYCNEKKYKVALSGKLFNIVELNHKFIEQDIILPHESMPMELGRGCIFKCKFCSYLNIGKKKGTYQRKYDLILDEIKYTYDTFGNSNFMFLDDTINEDQEKMNFISSIRDKTKIDLTWNGFLRADLVWSHKNYNQLLDGGLRAAYFGLESFHPKTSKSIGKGWMGVHAKEWLPHLHNNLWKNQVSFEGTFIVGLPYETENDLISTVNWIKNNNIGSFYFVPYNLRNEFEEGAPTSEFTREYKKYSYVIDDNDNWVNTETNIDKFSAMRIAHHLNQETQHLWKIAGWRTNSYYNLGLEYKDIHKIYVKDGNKLLHNKKNLFLKKYIEKYRQYYTKN